MLESAEAGKGYCPRKRTARPSAACGPVQSSVVSEVVELLNCAELSTNAIMRLHLRLLVVPLPLSAATASSPSTSPGSLLAGHGGLAGPEGVRVLLPPPRALGWCGCQCGQLLSRAPTPLAPAGKEGEVHLRQGSRKVRACVVVCYVRRSLPVRRLALVGDVEMPQASHRHAWELRWEQVGTAVSAGSPRRRANGRQGS